MLERVSCAKWRNRGAYQLLRKKF